VERERDRESERDMYGLSEAVAMQWTLCASAREREREKEREREREREREQVRTHCDGIELANKHECKNFIKKTFHILNPHLITSYAAEAYNQNDAEGQYLHEAGHRIHRRANHIQIGPIYQDGKRSISR